MLPSLSKFLTVAAALSATAYASPQGWGGSSGGGSSSGSSGSSGQSGSGSQGGSESSGESGTQTTSEYYGSSTSVTVASAVAASTATSTSAALADDVACNGSHDLCSRTYDNITHMGAHDSSFVRDDSTDNSIAGTQYYNATYALNNGLRLLTVQAHDSNGTIELCHTTCSLLDAGSLQSFLVAIKDWMDNNEDDVVTLLIVNSDSFNATDFGPVFEASGIDKYGYTPTGTDSSSVTWPTLQDMINADTRLVTFIASYTYSSDYSYLLNEWDYVFETAYEVTSLSGFNCTIDRPSTYSSASSAISAGMLPLVNHFAYTVVASYEIPDASDIDVTNSPDTDTTGNLGLHAQTCKSEYGQKPTFMLVDFFNKGPAIETGDNLNGITASGRSNSTSADGSSSTSDAGRIGHKSSAALLAAVVMTALLA